MQRAQQEERKPVSSKEIQEVVEKANQEKIKELFTHSKEKSDGKAKKNGRKVFYHPDWD